MKKTRFYLCKHCGNLIGMIEDSGVPVVCCGEPMTALEANTVDASKEKHVPVVTIDGDLVTVSVGEVPHPMTPEHLIQWIYLATVHGGQRKALKSDELPVVSFRLHDDLPVAAYAYCNLHRLWKTSL